MQLKENSVNFPEWCGFVHKLLCIFPQTNGTKKIQKL